jgi:hypothetical protein
MHQMVANTLHILTHAHAPQNITQANAMINSFLAATALQRCSATRCSIYGPSIVGNLSRIFCLPAWYAPWHSLIADLEMIRQRWQVLIDDRLMRSNMKRRTCDYDVGDNVLLLASDPNKMQAKGTGQF